MISYPSVKTYLGCSKELSRGSFEYPNYVCWFKNMKINFLVDHHPFILRPDIHLSRDMWFQTM